jgi:hypothetical protein
MKPKEEPRVILAPTPETDAAFDIRHTKTCTIAHFRQVMEKMERERDKALADLEEERSKPKAKPKRELVIEQIGETVVVEKEVAP